MIIYIYQVTFCTWFLDVGEKMSLYLSDFHKQDSENERLLMLLRQLLCDENADFRGRQRGIISRIIGGKDTLAILPTGSGKSVCYQVPGLYLDGLTIVVTPLIALMQDQVMRLRKAGIPAACLCFIPSEAVTAALNAMPAWLTGGMAVGGGMVAAVGYCMVINMMASKEVWPFFALGFVLAAIKELTLIALGVIGVSLAIIYLGLKDMAKSGSGAAAGSGDPLGDILDDYE